MEKIKTSLDLANGILKEIQDNGVDTSKIEYIGDSVFAPIHIYDVEFDLVGKLSYGSCEGICFDISMVGSYEQDVSKESSAPLITGKCHGTSREDMENIGKIMADIIFYGTKYIGKHADEYIRRGFRCYVPGKSNSIWTASEENAKKYMQKGYSVKDLYTGQELE